MPALNDSQRTFLDEPFAGVVTTVRPDGSLHSTVVWVGAEDGDAVFNTLRSRAKARHLERDPRVSLLVVDPGNPYRWLTLSGAGRLAAEGADERLDRFARRYLGQDRYPWRRPGATWVTVRITADRIASQGLEGEGR